MNKHYVAAYILSFFLILLLVSFYIKYCAKSKSPEAFCAYESTLPEPLFTMTHEDVPKIIWMYWDSSKPPKIVKDCVYQIKKTYSDYIIRFLNENNIRSFVPDSILNLRHAQDNPKRSDFIRLFLMKYYGGIWIDASFKLNKKLPINHEKDVTIYKTPSNFNSNIPVLENWYICAKKNAPFIRAWFDEFIRVNEFDTMQEYVKDLKIKGTNVEFDGIYLTMHLAAYHILRTCPEYLPTLHVMSSVEDKGPFSLHDKINFVPEEFKEYYCKEKHKHPYIKLRGIDRKQLERN